MLSISRSTGTRRQPPAYLVWGAGVVTYIIAIAGRTSFGVAGIAATERFGISASQLASFVVIHMAVYALAQIPVGILLDRLGPRRMLSWGAVLLALGQLAVAFAPTYVWALLARILVGLGDATAFVSVVRLVPAWFPARRVPLMTQLTGLLGQLGPIISAVPFLAILGAHGWPAAFLFLAASGVVVAIVAGLAIRDTPTPAETRPTPQLVRAALGTVVRHPGCWLAFFTHFTLLFPTNVFIVLWGMPILTQGQGFSTTTAAALLSLNSLAGFIAGPTIAAVLVRHPQQRALFVLGIAALTAATWLLLLVPVGPRPIALWALLVIVLAFSGSGSSIAFDFARTSLPPRTFGTGSGFVNTGGFISSIAALQLVGVILDRRAPDHHYAMADFSAALAVMIPLAVVGLIGILISRHLLRRHLARTGIYPLTVPQIVRQVLATPLPRERTRRRVERLWPEQ